MIFARVAWFSPMPPVRTGIAGRSAELVPALRARGYAVDVFDEPAAHDFVWRHAQQPYDLIVYQFGNSSHHDYIWAYALRYPGLVVLHDTRLHHARAAFLLREKRVADYRAEFAWNEPGVSPDLAELAVAGFDSALYYEWPMVRSLVAAAKLVAVHGEGAAEELRQQLANSPTQFTNSPTHQFTNIVSVRLGEGVALSDADAAAARRRVRAKYGIPDEDIVFGVFGGLTPEKRLPQILAAFRATRLHAPSARLLLAGAAAGHYDVAADVAGTGAADRITLTGYLADEGAIAEHLAACDVSLNLRWPTARETSGPWLRALAMALPTVITDLAHLGDVPSLDPRTWTRHEGQGARGEERGAAGTQEMRSSLPDPRSSQPVCVAIDILDEDHSLRLAMRRLAADGELRAHLGRAAREWWTREHAPAVMVDDYACVMEEAAARPDPAPAGLPAHVRYTGDAALARLSAPFGVADALRRDGLLR